MKSTTNIVPNGVFLFIDDNPDELLLLRTAIKDLGYTNDIVECLNAAEGLKYLKESTKDICFILADIKMPKMDGLQLKREIEKSPELKIKSIPFIYHTNEVNEEEIKEAYRLNVQGYFLKALNLDDTKEMLKLIVTYWANCIHPRSTQRLK